MKDPLIYPTILISQVALLIINEVLSGRGNQQENIILYSLALFYVLIHIIIGIQLKKQYNSGNINKSRLIGNKIFVKFVMVLSCIYGSILFEFALQDQRKAILFLFVPANDIYIQFLFFPTLNVEMIDIVLKYCFLGLRLQTQLDFDLFSIILVLLILFTSIFTQSLREAKSSYSENEKLNESNYNHEDQIKQQLYREILQIIPAGVAIINSNGDIVYKNENFVQLSEFQSEQDIKQQIFLQDPETVQRGSRENEQISRIIEIIKKQSQKIKLTQKQPPGNLLENQQNYSLTQLVSRWIKDRSQFLQMMLLIEQDQNSRSEVNQDPSFFQYLVAFYSKNFIFIIYGIKFSISKKFCFQEINGDSIQFNIEVSEREFVYTVNSMSYTREENHQTGFYYLVIVQETWKNLYKKKYKEKSDFLEGFSQQIYREVIINTQCMSNLQLSAAQNCKCQNDKINNTFLKPSYYICQQNLDLFQNIGVLNHLVKQKLSLRRKKFSLLDKVQNIKNDYISAAQIKNFKIQLNFDPSIPHFIINDDDLVILLIKNLLNELIKWYKVQFQQGTMLIDISQATNVQNQLFSIQENQVLVRIAISQQDTRLEREQLENWNQSLNKHLSYSVSQLRDANLNLILSNELVQQLTSHSLKGITVQSEPELGTQFEFIINFFTEKLLNQEISFGGVPKQQSIYAQQIEQQSDQEDKDGSAGEEIYENQQDLESCNLKVEKERRSDKFKTNPSLAFRSPQFQDNQRDLNEIDIIQSQYDIEPQMKSSARSSEGRQSSQKMKAEFSGRLSQYQQDQDQNSSALNNLYQTITIFDNQLGDSSSISEKLLQMIKSQCSSGKCTSQVLILEDTDDINLFNLIGIFQSNSITFDLAQSASHALELTQKKASSEDCCQQYYMIFFGMDTLQFNPHQLSKQIKHYLIDFFAELPSPIIGVQSPEEPVNSCYSTKGESKPGPQITGITKILLKPISQEILFDCMLKFILKQN